ncbi:MAG: c-type cytochrome [Candidatus Methylomirabilaceae bacterium]
MSQVAMLLTLFALHFGGWAVITVEDLPDQVVVGQPVTLTFAVRQHGRTLLSGLNPRVEAKGGGQTVRAAAAPATGTGRYAATLTLPNAGAWTLTVYSGFGPSNVTLMPLPAVNPGRAPVEPALATRGQRLFVAKGCLTCHLHTEVPASGVVRVGADLSGRRYAAEYLQRFLADPSSVTTRRPGGEEMPDLNLAPREIAALTAFINGEKAPQAGE